MQILNAIREHYPMKREADHGSQLFWDRIFSSRLAEFTPASRVAKRWELNTVLIVNTNNRTTVGLANNTGQH